MKRSHVSTKTLKKFKKLLLAKQNEFSQDATFREEDKPCCALAGLPDMPMHVVDLAGSSLNCNKVTQFMGRDKRFLARIEDALARIDAGTYGICEGDGELITKTRLQTVPWTRYCAKCARLAQMGLLSSEDSFGESDDRE